MIWPRHPLTWLLRVLIKGYQWLISPVLPGNCRFYPTCSAYALQAVDDHGPFKGAWLGVKRILRCHPWNDGGYDPVPFRHHEDHTHKSDGSCHQTGHKI